MSLEICESSLLSLGLKTEALSTSSGAVVSADARADYAKQPTAAAAAAAAAANVTLRSVDHPYSLNNASSYTSYFYTNTNAILNKFVMSYEEQLHRAIARGNIELCKELLAKRACNVNQQCNKNFPLCLACENNYVELVELLIQVKLNNCVQV